MKNGNDKNWDIKNTKINPNTKKTTPNSHSFTDEKRGGNGVKDMSVSLTKIDK